MGSRVAALACRDTAFTLVGGVVRSPDLTTPSSFPLSHRLQDFLDSADVIVDFTEPRSSLEHLGLAVRSGKAVVIGTTGFGKPQVRRIAQAGRKVPIVMASNMSLGANLLFYLAGLAAAKLPGYDAEIIEVHHRHKKDAPSGTALRLAQSVACSRSRSGLGDFKIQPCRCGTSPRGEQEIGIASVRAGDVVGEHTLILAGEGERVELSHRAFSRDVFAQGALSAAKWVCGKKPGWYDMSRVLGLGLE